MVDTPNNPIYGFALKLGVLANPVALAISVTCLSTIGYSGELPLNLRFLDYYLCGTFFGICLLTAAKVAFEEYGVKETIARHAHALMMALTGMAFFYGTLLAVATLKMALS